MGKDAHTGKDIPEQWDEIKYFGITEDVLDAKGNTRYTALMYKVEKKSKGVKVSMQNPEYNKTMSWDDFMIFVLDKGRVVETGTHTELVRKEGHYFTLVSNQLELGI